MQCGRGLRRNSKALQCELKQTEHRSASENLRIWDIIQRVVSLAQTFSKMNCGLNSELGIDDETLDGESNGSDDDGNEEERNSSGMQETTEIQETAKNKNAQAPSFQDALRLLCNGQYHLVGAYPELSQSRCNCCSCSCMLCNFRAFYF